MNPKSPSATRALPDFKESAVSLIKPRVYSAQGRSRYRPIFVLENPRCRNHIMFRCRAVAQLGRALEWGSRGREFKSLRPDFFFRISLHFSPETSRAVLFVIRLGVVDSMFSFRRLSLKKRFKLSFYRPFGSVFFFSFSGTDRNRSSPFTRPCQSPFSHCVPLLPQHSFYSSPHPCLPF